MGTNGNKSEASELVARCQAVGWQVGKTANGHWRVDTRKGAFTVSATPSDSRSVKNSLAEARRYGLERLEEAIKERLDRERQQKLEDDRKLNNAKLARIEAANGTGAVKPAVLIDTTVDLGLGLVNGVAIAAIAPAMFKSPIMAKPSPLAGAEELLLVNDAVVYRCLRTGSSTRGGGIPADQVCHQVFTSVNSVKAHINQHAQRLNEKENETMKTTANVKSKSVEPSVAAMTTDQLKVELTRGLTSLVQAIDKIGAGSIEARNAALQLVELVQDLRTEVVVQEPDPELVAKARQFDALAETLGSLIK